MKRIVAMVTLLTMLSIPAVSASEMSGSYSDGVYTVSGTADTEGMPVRIEILKNGYVFDDLKSAQLDDISDYYLFADTVAANEDKSFTFSAIVPESVTNHVVRVSFFGSNTILADSFATYSEEDMNTAVNSFLADSEKTVQELESLVNSYYGKLGIDYDSFKKLDTDTICKNVINSLKANSTSSDLKVAISANIAVEQIDNAADLESVVELIGINADKLGIKTTLQWTAWSALDDDAKQSLAEAFSGKGLAADKLVEVFKDTVVMYELKKALWNEQQEILEKYDADTRLSETDIDKVTSSSRLKSIFTDFKAMVADGSVTKCSQIKDTIDELIEKYPKENTKPSLGLGGGGGGGGGGSVSITAPEEEKEEVKEIVQPFEDLNDVEWAQPAITYLYNEGIVNGKSDSEFCPNDNITREEYAAMLVRCFGIETDGAECGFDDVKPDNWSYKYIAAARKAGIVNGISDNSFGVGENISRQDMAVMAYRAAKKYGAEFNTERMPDFSDIAEISSYAMESVDMMASAGIINGTGKGFEPMRNSTRAEAAKVIYGLLLHCGIIG